MSTKEFARYLGLNILGLMLIVCPALAGVLPNRTWASATITTIPTYRLQNITDTWGGNTTREAGPNFGMLIFNAVSVYPDAMGQIAYVVLFAIPFLMMWIVQADMTMPAIIGMFFSLYIFVKIPEQYILFVVGSFIICFAALLWSLYRRAY